MTCLVIHLDTDHTHFNIFTIESQRGSSFRTQTTIPVNFSNKIIQNKFRAVTGVLGVRSSYLPVLPLHKRSFEAILSKSFEVKTVQALAGLCDPELETGSRTSIMDFVIVDIVGT